MSVTLEEDNFGQFTDPISNKIIPIKRFTWTNQSKISVQVINYGATITSINLPDKNGKIEDIVLGFDNMNGYLSKTNRYFGCTVGRNSNRIANGQIRIYGTVFELTKNIEPNQLHGGFKGFDKVVWEPFVNGTKLILSYHSANLEEGYPGDVIANVSFELTNDNEFLMQIQAVTTKATIVNMTNHSYFNLAGHNKGAAELYKHLVCINADNITDVDENAIPTGTLKPVEETAFDLRNLIELSTVINSIPPRGFDHNFCINKLPNRDNTFIARAYHPESGRILEVYSNQPGVQFYTANFLPEDSDTSQITGKGGNNYYKQGAFCLETQNWPNAPNHENFPNAILDPGDTYNHSVSYKFLVGVPKCLKI